MTGSTTQQPIRLRLFLALGAITLTLATALATVSEAAAQGDHSTGTSASGAQTSASLTTAEEDVFGRWATSRFLYSAEEAMAPATETEAQQAQTLRIVIPGLVSSYGIEAEGTGAAPVEEIPAEQPVDVAPPVEEPAPAPAPEVAPEPAPPVAAPPAASAGNCPVIIYEALGLAGCKISYCESTWNPNAIGGSGELGWFQVSPRWHPDATTDPAGNVAAAVRISKNGTDWSAWSVRAVLSTGHCPNGVAYPG